MHLYIPLSNIVNLKTMIILVDCIMFAKIYKVMNIRIHPDYAIFPASMLNGLYAIR